MNKRFDQLTAGAYDSSLIIPVEDPATQNYFKLPLSAIPSGGSPILQSKSGAVSSPGASVPVTYDSYTIPANIMNASGKGIKLQMMWEWTIGGAGLQVAIYWNGVGILSLTAAQLANHFVEIDFYWLTVNTARYHAWGFQSNAVYTSQGASLVGRDWTIPNTIRVDLNSVNAGATTMYALTYYSINL